MKINLNDEKTRNELDIILKNIGEAGEYFRNQPQKNTEEYKLLKQLIKTAAKLQEVLNREKIK